MSYTLQNAHNYHAAAIKKLLQSVLKEYGLCADPVHTDADLDDLESYYHGRGGVFKVLLDAEKNVIGSYGLCRINTECAELRKMYLYTAYRGQGLGCLMLEDALQEARQRRLTRINLETAVVLKEAIRLYKYYGFQPYRREAMSSRCDSAYYLELDV